MGPPAQHMHISHFYLGSLGQSGAGEGKAPSPKCYYLCHWRKESGQSKWEPPREKKRERRVEEGNKRGRVSALPMGQSMGQVLRSLEGGTLEYRWDTLGCVSGVAVLAPMR